MASPLWPLPLEQIQFAVVDVETTGFRPGWDRVIEVAIVHVSAAAPAQLAFDSMINPQRPVGETVDVHGLGDELLAEAPCIEDVAGPLLDGIRGRVVVAHNAPFDLRFLRAELARVGVDLATPYLCSMELLAALGIAPRCSLDELRQRFPLPAAGVHAARVDAMAVGFLLAHALMQAHHLGMTTFGALRKLRGAFVASLAVAPMRSERATHGYAKPRPAPPPAQAGSVSYMHAVRDAIDDFVLDDVEIERLKNLQRLAALPRERIRAVHASAMAWALHVVADDAVVSDGEVERLWRLHAGLRALGWAPGDGA